MVVVFGVLVGCFDVCNMVWIFDVDMLLCGW